MAGYDDYVAWCERLGIPPATAVVYRDENKCDTNEVGMFRGANQTVWDMENGSMSAAARKQQPQKS